MIELGEIISRVKQHPKLVIADDYEVSVQQSIGGERSYLNGVHSSTSDREETWISLRLLHRNHPGRSSVLLGSADLIDVLVEEAFLSAENSMGDPWFRLPILALSSRTSARSLFTEEEYKNHILAWASVYPQVGPTDWEIEEKLKFRETKTSIRRKREKTELDGREYWVAHEFEVGSLQETKNGRLSLSDQKVCVQSLLQRMKWKDSGDIIHVEKGADVVFSPNIVVAILKEIAPWFYADAVQERKSPLVEFLGSKIFSKQISLLDCGSLPVGGMNCEFDSEGVMTKQNTLVREGILQDFLYDTYTATRENRLSTGNFYRTHGESRARITHSNFYIAPGEFSPEQLRENFQSGFWLMDLERIIPEANKPTCYSLIASGLQVSSSGKTSPLRHATLSFDVFQLLERVVATGSDLQFHGEFGSPSILVRELP